MKLIILQFIFCIFLLLTLTCNALEVTQVCSSSTVEADYSSSISSINASSDTTIVLKKDYNCKITQNTINQINGIQINPNIQSLKIEIGFSNNDVDFDFDILWAKFNNLANLHTFYFEFLSGSAQVLPVYQHQQKLQIMQGCPQLQDFKLHIHNLRVENAYRGDAGYALPDFSQFALIQQIDVLQKAGYVNEITQICTAQNLPDLNSFKFDFSFVDGFTNLDCLVDVVVENENLIKVTIDNNKEVSYQAFEGKLAPFYSRPFISIQLTPLVNLSNIEFQYSLKMLQFVGSTKEYTQKMCKNVSSTASCIACTQDDCISCSNTECLMCVDGFILYQGRCVLCTDNCDDCLNIDVCTACIDDTYYLDYHDSNNPTFSMCEECISPCITCTTLTSCKTCIAGLYLNIDDNSCLQCQIDNCIECETLSKCTKCVENKKYFLETDFTCKRCINNCDLCTSKTDCEVCLDNYYPDSNADCQQCTSPCYNCTDSSTCTSCIKNYYLVGSDCIECTLQSNSYTVFSDDFEQIHFQLDPLSATNVVQYLKDNEIVELNPENGDILPKLLNKTCGMIKSPILFGDAKCQYNQGERLFILQMGQAAYGNYMVGVDIQFQDEVILQCQTIQAQSEPQIQILAPADQSHICSDIDIKINRIYKNGGYGLINITWSLINTLSDANIQNKVQQILQNSKDQSAFSLSVNELLVQTQYQIKVDFTGIFGISGSHIFTYQSGGKTGLDLKPQSYFSKLNNYDELTFGVDIKQFDCQNGSFILEKKNINLKWQLENDSIPGSIEEKQIENNINTSQSTLTLPPYHMLGGYHYTLTAYAEITENIVSNNIGVINFYIMHAPLIAYIIGGSRFQGYGQKLIIEGVGYDIEEQGDLQLQGLTYEWTCHNIAKDEDCYYIDGRDVELQQNVNKQEYNEKLFTPYETLEFSFIVKKEGKDDQVGKASYSITELDLPALEMQLPAFMEDTSKKININQDILLDVIEDTPSQYVNQYNVGILYKFDNKGLKQFEFKRMKFQIQDIFSDFDQEDETTIIIVQKYDPQYYMPSQFKINVVVNKIPTLGDILIAPIQGNAVSDIFNIKAENFFDIDQPLQYKFMYFSKKDQYEDDILIGSENLQKKSKLIKDYSFSNSINTILPSPDDDNDLLIMVMVQDSLGGIRNQTQTVQVNKITSITDQYLNDLQNTINNDSIPLEDQASQCLIISQELLKNNQLLDDSQQSKYFQTQEVLNEKFQQLLENPLSESVQQQIQQEQSNILSSDIYIKNKQASQQSLENNFSNMQQQLQNIKESLNQTLENIKINGMLQILSKQLAQQKDKMSTLVKEIESNYKYQQQTMKDQDSSNLQSFSYKTMDMIKNLMHLSIDNDNILTQPNSDPIIFQGQNIQFQTQKMTKQKISQNFPVSQEQNIFTIQQLNEEEFTNDESLNESINIEQVEYKENPYRLEEDFPYSTQNNIMKILNMTDILTGQEFNRDDYSYTHTFDGITKTTGNFVEVLEDDLKQIEEGKKSDPNAGVKPMVCLIKKQQREWENSLCETIEKENLLGDVIISCACSKYGPVTVVEDVLDKFFKGIQTDEILANAADKLLTLGFWTNFMTVYVISFFFVQIMVSPILCKMDYKETKFRQSFKTKVQGHNINGSQEEEKRQEKSIFEQKQYNTSQINIESNVGLNEKNKNKSEMDNMKFNVTNNSIIDIEIENLENSSIENKQINQQNSSQKKLSRRQILRQQQNFQLQSQEQKEKQLSDEETPKSNIFFKQNQNDNTNDSDKNSQKNISKVDKRAYKIPIEKNEVLDNPITFLYFHEFFSTIVTYEKNQARFFRLWVYFLKQTMVLTLSGQFMANQEEGNLIPGILFSIVASIINSFVIGLVVKLYNRKNLCMKGFTVILLLAIQLFTLFLLAGTINYFSEEQYDNYRNNWYISYFTSLLSTLLITNPIMAAVQVSHLKSCLIKGKRTCFVGMFTSETKEEILLQKYQYKRSDKINL